MDSCPICFEKISQNPELPYRDLKCVYKSKVTLKCNHCFHHDCLIDWIAQPSSYNYYCPYCRDKIKYYIELPSNMFPIKYIHKEYNEVQNCIDLKDENKLKEVCSKYFNEKYCNCILKTGNNKGHQCSRKKSPGSNMCKLHFNKYTSLINMFTN